MKRAAPAIASLTLLFVGCGGDDPAPTSTAGGSISSPEAGVVGAPDAAPDIAIVGEAGPDAPEQNTSRGDPSNFPTACTESCKEACANVAACDGANASFPVADSSCEQRCGMALKGPMWDDVSGNFRCCASQDACFDVSTCGGWLAHPGPLNSCEKLCKCLVGASTVPATAAGVPPLPGYSVAHDAIVFEGTVPQPLTRALGAETIFEGRHTALRFPFPVSSTALDALRAAGARSLPTFYDEKGRLVAAAGGIVLQLSSPKLLAKATATLAARGLPSPSALAYGRNLYFVSGDAWASMSAAGALASIQGVVAEPNMLRTYVKRHIPNDPLFVEQWHLRNAGDKGSIAGVDGRVAEAWDLTKGSPEVVIAINDDGVDVNHADLAANTLPPLNFPDGWEGMLTSGYGGFGSHGTSCAGVAAAAGDNALGGAGVCPECSILPHALGEIVGASFNITDKDVADGFARMVDQGAWIISNSWGPGGEDPRFQTGSFPTGAVPTIIKTAFDYAETQGRDGKGTVVLFAAGNENAPVDAYAGYLSNVAVAAVDDQGLKSYYSNYGGRIAITAPSNGGIRGITTTAAAASGQPSAYTDSFGGTSSACPFAAGVAGLVLAANPELTALEVRTILRKSATKIDPVWGNWSATGHSPYYGDGLVNAYSAVKLALGQCTAPEDCKAPSDECGQDCEGGFCSPCRTSADCADTYKCQAVLPLGMSICVAPKPTGAVCPSGSSEMNGYCIPSRQACGLCTTAEQCNGRDDNCNGSVDDGIACDGIPSCAFSGTSCDDGEVCAGIHCSAGCSATEDCAEGYTCLPAKDRYGVVDPSRSGCGSDDASTCKIGCQVLASSLDDATLQKFIDCMKDGATACSSAQYCAIHLPIKF